MRISTPARIGLIGCGNISPAYLRASNTFPQLEIVVCADVVPEAARKREKEYGIRAVSVDEVFSDASIEIVLGLTPPQNHAPIIRRALEAGKHAYTEKPLALSTGEAEPLLALARERSLRIGCAPDTVLGGGIQTARKAVDDGLIGRQIGGTAFMFYGGPESWHPNPAFFYQRGAGPLFDMGPYYLTALVSLLGPIQRIFASGQITHEERVFGAGPRKGETFPVEVPTYIAALLLFESGSTVHLGISFDVPLHTHSHIELYGTEGTLVVPDPNRFSGNVRLARTGGSWSDVAHSHGFGDRDWRGLGLAEMVEAIRAGVPHRASADMAYHVLEVMEAIAAVAIGGGEQAIYSRCERPRPLKPVEPTYDLS
jgi:predicted dehydrogenase